MVVRFIPDPEQEALIRQAIASGRLRRPDEAAKEAFLLWEQRERSLMPRLSEAAILQAQEKARAFETWARSHPATPPLSDDAIKRGNLVRDGR
jgi:hypothetical protein